MEVVGIKTNFERNININPVNESKTQLIGSVIYVDNFGNVTNIKKIFFRVKNLEISFLCEQCKISKIYNSYSESIDFVPKKQKRRGRKKKNCNLEFSRLFRNSNIKAIHEVGSANSLFGLEFRTTITVKFY